MKKLAYLRFILAFAAFAVTLSSAAQWGIFQTYAIFDSGSGNSFRAGSINSDGARSFINHDYGVFRSGDTFVLNGGEVKTFKNTNGNACGATLFYRVYADGDTPGGFTSIGLPFDANLGGGDQRWAAINANINLLTGLDDGEYVIELYWEAEGNETNPGGCGEFLNDSNPGNDWKGFFRVVNDPGVVFKMDGTGETKTVYTAGNVTLSAINWFMEEALIGTIAGDKLNGERSLRIRRNGTTPGIAEMQDDLTTGIGKIGFNYARYGTEINQPELFVEYSIDGGTWTQAGASITTFPDQLTWWEEELNLSGNVRVRFRTNTDGTNQRRISIDDIIITENGCQNESFENLPTASAASYLARTWTGDGGEEWNATLSRTDQTLNGKAICFRQIGAGDVILTAPVTTDGIGVIRFWAVRGFTGTGARSLQIAINGEPVGAPITISATSVDPVYFEVEANVGGTAELTIQNLGAQVNLDDLSWTCYTAPIETGAVSEPEFVLSDCNTTNSGTVAFTTNTFFGGSNTFTAELSDATGDFTQALAIGSGTSSPISITIPENLPTGTGYRIRVVSSAPAFTGTVSDAFTITQNGDGCPVLGDYRTQDSGSFTTASIWQVYAYNATTQVWAWVTATNSPDNAEINATIRNGHTVALGTSNITVNTLTIDAGGRLYRNNTTCGQLRYLTVAGDIVCNGAIGNGTTLDAIGFNILSGTHTISGSGDFDAFRIRLGAAGSTSSGTAGSAVLNIEMDVTLRWYESACTGGFNAIYNDRGATSTFDVVVASGTALTLTGAEATFGMDGTNSAPNIYVATALGGGYTVFGAIECAGGYVAGSNNPAAQRTYLDIRDGGVVRTRFIQIGDNNGSDGGEIILASGALLEITGVASDEITWTDLGQGSLLFNLHANSNVVYSSADSQDIPAVAEYGNLTLSGGGTKLFIDEETTIKGSFTFESGVTVSGGDATYLVSVGANWINNGGTFDRREGTVQFNGPAPQTLGGTDQTAFYNVIMDKTGKLSLGSNTDLYGVLSPEAGDFDGELFDLRLISDENGTGSIGEIKPGATYIGNTIIERYIPSGVQFWVNLSNPIPGSTVDDWNASLLTTGFTGSDFPGYNFNNVLQYDETVPGGLNDGFEGASNVTDVLDHIRGYFVYMQAGDQNVTVEGEIQQGPLTTPLNYTSTGVPANDGWELVANRYPSEIDWEELYTLSSGISDSYYIYDADAGAYTLYTAGFGPTGVATGFIPSSQSFWVQTIEADAELNFDESIKSNTGTGFERSYYAVPRITLTLNRGSQTHTANISFDETTSIGFDHGRDAVWFPSSQENSPQLATLASSGEKLSLNRLNIPEGPASIPVFVRANAAGTYTFEVADMAFLPDGLCLALEDLFTGEINAVAEGDTYVWEQQEAFVGERFVLHLSIPMQAEAHPTLCQGAASGSVEVNVWAEGGELVLETWQGALVASEPITGQQTVTFTDLAAGDYIVRFISDDLVCQSVEIELYVEEPFVASVPVVNGLAAVCTEPTAELIINGFIGDFTADVLRDGELIGSYTTTQSLELLGLDGGLYQVIASDVCTTATIDLDLRDPNALNEEVLIEAVYGLTQGVANVTAEVLTDVPASITWSINNEEVAQGPVLNITLTEAGDYLYTVFIEGMQCSSLREGTFSVQEVSTVAGMQSEELQLLHAPGEWLLRGSAVTGQLNIDVFAVDGSLIRREAKTGDELLRINNTRLAHGIYTVSISDHRGTPIATFRAVR